MLLKSPRILMLRFSEFIRFGPRCALSKLFNLASSVPDQDMARRH